MKVLKEIKCKTWEEFKSKAHYLPSKEDYLFRGQNDANWILETSMQRFLKKAGVTKISLGGADPITDILKKYIPLINKTEKGNSYSDNNDYWGIGQHYGLPTNYLDWTKAIYKAAFFAFCEEIFQNNTHADIAIYGIKIKNIHELGNSSSFQSFINSNGGIKAFERDGFSIVEQNSKLVNNRLDAQDGLFTHVSGLANLSLDLVDFFTEKIYQVYRLDRPIMVKFIIPRNEYKNALSDLNHSSQINFFKIYPDKEGCAKQALLEFLLGI